MSTASTIVVIVVAVIFLGFFIKLLKTPIRKDWLSDVCALVNRR